MNRISYPGRLSMKLSSLKTWDYPTMELGSSAATIVQSIFNFKDAAVSYFPSPLAIVKSSFSSPVKFSLSTTPSRGSFSRRTFRSNDFSRFVVSAAPPALNDAIADSLPADILVTETPEPNSRVRLSVEVPAEVCDDCYRRVLKEFMKLCKIPGFRPGKNVPEDILIGFVGKENVKKATIESILKRTLPHALSSVSGRALEDSVRISTKFPDIEKTYNSMKSLRYDVIVDVAPEVKWKPEHGYRNLKITVDIDKEIDAHTAVEQEVKRRIKALSSLRIVTDRGLEVGDVAILDMTAATIEQDASLSKPIPSAESKGFQFDSDDSDRVLPDFLNSIIGINRGETRSFPYVFPDSWKQEELRGVCAQFTVECKELFYRSLPEIDDSLSNKLLSGCTTIKEVKEVLLQKFLELEQTAKEQATDNAILDQLQKMVEVEIPPSLFEEQGRQLYGAQLLQIQANNKLTEQQLASFSSPKAVKEFLETQRENITAIIKQNLAVGDIFKRENLQILTDELVKEVEKSIVEFQNQKQEYDEERIKGQVQEVLEGAKVLEWLREQAEIKYITK